MTASPDPQTELGPARLRVAVTRLPHAADLDLPRYATAQSAGLDLAAAIETPVTLTPGDRRLFATGLVLHLPAGYEGQIRPRSGLALKHGITCLNAPGTIDADYRGEVGVILINHGQEPVTIDRGMRIAQLVIAPVLHATLFEASHPEEAEEAADSNRVRGAGGFGSTGTSAAEPQDRSRHDKDGITETKR